VLLGDQLGTERGRRDTQGIDHDQLLRGLVMTYRRGKIVMSAAANVREPDIGHAADRRALEYVGRDAILDDLAGQEGFDIGPELGEIFAGIDGVVRRQGGVDLGLRIEGVEIARRASGDQGRGIARGAP
jgi:hypothetical protein